MRKIKLLCLVCIFPLILSACYDHREIDTVATVMAVGIEEGKKEGEKLYTFALSDTGGYQSDSSGDGASLICYTQRAGDIKTAVYELDKKISKSLSFSHISAIFFSFETAKKDMYADGSFFEKDYKVRPQVIVAVTALSPREYLEGLNPRLEANPEKYFRSMFAESDSYVPSLKLREFTDSCHCRETSLVPVLSGKVDEEKIREGDTRISSAGLVCDGKLVAEIKNHPFTGLFFSDKEVWSGNAVLKRKGKPKITIALDDAKPKVTVKLSVTADGKVNSSAIKKSGERFLKDYAQKGIDVLNIRRYAKKEFFTLKESEKMDWNEVLKNTEFDLKIKTMEKGEM